MAIGHFGNFELYARFMQFLPAFKCLTTYRALNQPLLNRLRQLAMTLCVLRAVGAHLDELDPARRRRVRHRHRHIGGTRHPPVAGARGGGEGGEVDAVGRAPERFVLGQLRLGKQREDAAAVIVDDSNDQIHRTTAPAQQGARVVEDGEISEQRVRRGVHRRHSQRGRH